MTILIVSLGQLVDTSLPRAANTFFKLFCEKKGFTTPNQQKEFSAIFQQKLATLQSTGAFEAVNQTDDPKAFTDLVERLNKIFEVEMDFQEFKTAWNSMSEVSAAAETTIKTLVQIQSSSAFSVMIWADTNQLHFEKIEPLLKERGLILKKEYMTCFAHQPRETLLTHILESVQKNKEPIKLFLPESGKDTILSARNERAKNIFSNFHSSLAVGSEVIEVSRDALCKHLGMYLNGIYEPRPAGVTHAYADARSSSSPRKPLSGTTTPKAAQPSCL